MRTNVYRNPAREFSTFADAMNRAFGFDSAARYDFARNGGHNGNTSNKMRLPIDIWTEDEAFIITAYVPGVDPEAVEITMEGEELTIRGNFPVLEQPTTPVVEGENEDEATAQSVETKREFIKRELYRGAFERRMTINVPVDVENIQATYEYGVLTLRVPKAEAVRPKQIKIVAKA